MGNISIAVSYAKAPISAFIPDKRRLVSNVTGYPAQISYYANNTPKKFIKPVIRNVNIIARCVIAENAAVVESLHWQLLQHHE